MSGFAHEIYTWFLDNKRDLPWRKTSDPYKIWISEIILQQTRVAQGINYYERFIENFPTVFDLANATEDHVLKLWQGLGYYSRARNLHYSAKYLVEKYKGIFPEDYKSILELKGIGKYTAAAIASIAFNIPSAAVDGNVQRVISRYFGIKSPVDSNKGIKEIQQIADSLIDSQNPGTHNQAFMEFGALICTPKSPNCKLCPVVQSCYAFHNKQIEELPVKTKKTTQSNRFFYFYLLEGYDYIILEKRNNNDIWKNLYQLPILESKRELTDNEILRLASPINEKTINIKSVSNTVKHVLTHQKIFAKFIHFEQKIPFEIDSKFIQVNKKDIYKFAVPKLMERYFKKIKLL